ADDFGNLDADPMLFAQATIGRRADVTARESAGYAEEMLKVDLLRRYEVNGEFFFHIVGFLLIQPGGKNGKRIRRYPKSPWDDEEMAGCIPVNPDETSA